MELIQSFLLVHTRALHTLTVSIVRDFLPFEASTCNIDGCGRSGSTRVKWNVYFLPPFCWDLMTFLTIFASSIKNARSILVFTQSPHLEPPYALRTVFLVFETVAYLRGRKAGTPGRAIPQSPHLGAVGSFPMWW